MSGSVPENILILLGFQAGVTAAAVIAHVIFSFIHFCSDTCDINSRVGSYRTSIGRP